MNDIVFLYDQVIESIARLNAFCSMRTDELKGHDDIGNDVETVTELLAKRDLLVFAASMRNFIEATKGTKRAKDQPIITSDIFISAGPPFFRDTKETINVYQCLSRVIHAVDLRVFRNAADYYQVIAGNGKDYLGRLRDYESQGGNPRSPEEPLVGMMTEKDKLTLVRLQYILNASCKVLGELSDELGDKKQIFLQRDYR